MQLIEILNHNKKIKTVNDLLNNFDLVVEIAKDDINKIAESKRIFFSDFDYTYSESIEILRKQLQKTHLKSVNKFLQCENLENAAKWLIERLLNNMRNITTNQRYKLYCAPSVGQLTENIKSNNELFNNSVEVDLELEKAKKFSKEEKIKFLKEVWKDAIYDDFDIEDMKYLCNKLDMKIDEVFEDKGDLIKLNLRKEQDESCRSQLVFVF